MNGQYELDYAKAVAKERIRQAERRADEAVLLAGAVASHPVRARLGHGLIRLGMRLAALQTVPPLRPRPSPNC